MDDNKKRTQEKNPNYEEMIIEIVQRIEDERLLHFIYDLLVLFQKKWGI